MATPANERDIERGPDSESEALSSFVFQTTDSLPVVELERVTLPEGPALEQREENSASPINEYPIAER
jgi:hypothetical protein